MSFSVPILYLVFNRPDLVAATFPQLQALKPRKLYIGADGPRTYKPGEAEKCAQTRQYILDQIDWPCEVRTLFREENLGCQQAVSQAITWFFEQEEAGIILEDDIIADVSFFSFCQAMLVRYAQDERIMHISGLNFQQKTWGDASYYFSGYAASIWGWATWRRAWQKYDSTLPGMDAFFESSRARELLFYPEVVNYYQTALEATRTGKISSWGYIWLYSFWKAGGLSVVPNQNLIMNIGVGEDATHIQHSAHWQFTSKIVRMDPAQIISPKKIERHEAADRHRIEMKYNLGQSLFARLKLKARALIN